MRRLDLLSMPVVHSVLTANQEVENGLVVFLRSQERTKSQKESVVFAEKAVKTVMAQYDAGVVDFTRVTQIQQNLVQQQDTLAISKGEIAQGLLQVYKALGGGWEIGNHPSPRRPHLLRHHESTVVPQDAPPVARFGPPSCRTLLGYVHFELASGRKCFLRKPTISGIISVISPL